MIYAVGDIHGFSDSLEAALALIEADGGKDAPVVFLGDYVDRGPDSKATLQRLIDGQAEGRDWTCILGNHDRMFARFMADATQHDSRIASHKPWINPSLGGAQTLLSYGILDSASRGTDDIFDEARDLVPQSHLDFIAGLPLWHETKDNLFVHAGIRPGIPLEDQAEDDLIWIREPFLDDPRDYGKLIVHGHTARNYPESYPNRINLDGGAGFGNPLIPAVYEGGAWYLLTAKGREPFWSATANAA